MSRAFIWRDCPMDVGGGTLIVVRVVVRWTGKWVSGLYLLSKKRRHSWSERAKYLLPLCHSLLVVRRTNSLIACVCFLFKRL